MLRTGDCLKGCKGFPKEDVTAHIKGEDEKGVRKMDINYQRDAKAGKPTMARTGTIRDNKETKHETGGGVARARLAGEMQGKGGRYSGSLPTRPRGCTVFRLLP